MTQTKYRKMTRLETMTVGNLIMAHCHTVEDGSAEYEPGWSDERVHAESKVDTSLTNISTFRLQIIGRIRKPKIIENAVVNDNYRYLEMRLENLELWASERPVQPYKL